jgi:PPOX class probable F420-dependent enzyme
MSDPLVTPDERTFLAAARTATLATIADDGTPRLVPVCFAAVERSTSLLVYTPLDDKPKRTNNPRDLARVRDIRARPDIALLVHHWSEKWSELGWLRLRGTASLVEPDDAPEEHAAVVAGLRAKYPQYATHDLESRPLIRIAITGASRWGRLLSSG